MSESTREQLAELLHHLSTRKLLAVLERGACTSDDSLVLSPTVAAGLRRRVVTGYATLSEDERARPRQQAERVIALILAPESD